MNRKTKEVSIKMDSPRKTKQEDLEVTGVSRSGRVRKKSSKLMDFESPDEIDSIKFNRKNASKEKHEFATPQTSRQPKKQQPAYQMKQEDLLLEEELGRPFNLKDDSDESDTAQGFPQDESSFDSFDEELNDVDIDQGDNEGFQAIANDSSDDLAPQPLFIGENDVKKKLVIKDGKIVKAQRKDKGKARFTPYLLWSKEMRNELQRTHPSLDFTQINKKLGHMWSSVPMNEKYIWKRRAKRMATKAEIEAENTRKMNNKNRSPQRKYVNAKSHTPISRQNSSSQSVNLQSMSMVESRTNAKVNLLMDANSSVFKQVATAPLDVAAHLKLLGESLTIIGERLTEHEGQIAVSGSFSLLLDSLLCALVPLMCLTQQVPELNCIPQDLLSQSMDTIAYIMPGF